MANLKIGWIGTGVMGKSMCSHVMAAGNEAFVYNRTKSKAQELLDNGATWCDSPKEVAENADIIFTIVGYPKDVRETYLGENGILAGAKEGSIIVDMTTSEPTLAMEISDRAKEKGIFALDAPVTGGDIGAKNASLVIFVGGEKEAFDKVKSCFDCMGKTVQLMGKSGAGQNAKMANQIAIASNMVGAVEMLVYAQKAGLDLNQMIEMLGSGSAGSWQMSNMGPRMVKGDFEPGFYIKHFVKDMGIALDEAKKMNLMLPGLSMVHQFYLGAIAQGLEDKGTQALYEVLKNMNNI